ncbi:MAG: AEC family transporter [Clostridia bacterium]|nr:AEC family transporter [Clostridia bacterium]
MNISFFDVLITVLSLVLLAVPGFILAKLKLLPQKASETLSVIVLYVAQTLLVIMSFQDKEYTPTLGINMLYVAILAIIIHLLMFAVLYLIFLKKSANDRIRVLKFASVFSNCGFMGFPFLQSLFSDPVICSETLIYGAVIISIFNVMTWTVGVFVMTEDAKQVSIKKIILNPVIIGVIIGLLLFFVLKRPVISFFTPNTISYKITEKIVWSLNTIKELVTPLSMIVIGIRLGGINLKQLFLDKLAYLSASFKLILMSLISILAVAFLPIDTTIKYTVFFLLSMPSATSTVLFSVRFEKDSDFASVCVLLSTVLSTITIPLMYLVISGVFGVVI